MLLNGPLVYKPFMLDFCLIWQRVNYGGGKKENLPGVSRTPDPQIAIKELFFGTAVVNQLQSNALPTKLPRDNC